MGKLGPIRSYQYICIALGALTALVRPFSEAWLLFHESGGKSTQSTAKFSHLQQQQQQQQQLSPSKSRYYYANQGAGKKPPLSTNAVLQRWRSIGASVGCLEESLVKKKRFSKHNGTNSKTLSRPSKDYAQDFSRNRHDAVHKSLARAEDHVQAILELYENSSLAGSTADYSGIVAIVIHERSIYASILLSTLDGIVRALLRDPEAISASALGHVDNIIRRLVQKGGDRDLCLLVPSLQTLHSLWMIHQYAFQNDVQKPTPADAASASEIQSTDNHHHLCRIQCSLNLLDHWTRWSTDGFVAAPPPLYLLQVTQVMVRYNVSMTPKLWKLFDQAAINANSVGGPIDSNKTNCALPRELFSNMLYILSYSPTPDWKSLQTGICRQLIRLSTRHKLTDYLPTRQELYRALEASAEAGSAQDAAWAIRALTVVATQKNDTLLDNDNDGLVSAALKEPEPDSSLVMLFLTSLENSNEPGSFLYMEEYISNNRNNMLIKNCTAAFNKLLCKWAKSGASEAGTQANRIIQMFEPNAKSHYWVDLANQVDHTR